MPPSDVPCSSASSTSAGEDSQSEGSWSPRVRCPVAGRVWLLSQEPAGCRQVQEALDAAPCDAAREALVRELRGHVVKGMRDPHANHVLQKAISMMPPGSLQFMVEELLARDGLPAQAAKHRYACRIVQGLLRRCAAAEASGLVDALLRDAVALAGHSFGNFTLKVLLQVGTEEQRYRVVRALERNMGVVCRSGYGAGVIARAMEHADSHDRVWIARAALQEPCLLTCLAQSRHGDDAVLRMLQSLHGQEYTRACLSLVADLATLKASGFSILVAEYLEAHVVPALSRCEACL